MGQPQDPNPVDDQTELVQLRTRVDNLEAASASQQGEIDELRMVVNDLQGKPAS
jgi:uncharacterized coiled-coil protein SlyX